MHRIGRARIYLAILVTLFLESTTLNFIGIGSIRPNLMLVLIIFVGFHSDWSESLEAGLVGGLLRDVMGAGCVGINLVILGLCGLFAANCKNKVYKESFLTQIIVTLLIAVAINTSILFAKFVFKGAELSSINLWYMVLFSIAAVSLYTSLFAPPFFFCLRKLFKIEDSKF